MKSLLIISICFLNGFFSKAQEPIQMDESLKERMWLSSPSTKVYSSESAPVKIGLLEIQKTTKAELNSLLRLYHAEEVSSSVTQPYGLTQSLTVENGLNEPSEYNWSLKIVNDLNDSTKIDLQFLTIGDFESFFINQIRVDDIYINNLYLSFYKDTLAAFQYNTSFDNINYYTEKYKKQGTLVTKKTLKSGCKAAPTGNYTLFKLLNSNESILCFFSYAATLNSDCENASYIKVKSMDVDRAIIHMKIVDKEIVSRKQQRENKKLADHQKKLNNF
ncbi:MAG: hypothetical protein WKF88_05555 [Ferruginibacter sp.]